MSLVRKSFSLLLALFLVLSIAGIPHLVHVCTSGCTASECAAEQQPADDGCCTNDEGADVADDCCADKPDHHTGNSTDDCCDDMLRFTALDQAQSLNRIYTAPDAVPAPLEAVLAPVSNVWEFCLGVSGSAGIGADNEKGLCISVPLEVPLRI